MKLTEKDNNDRLKIEWEESYRMKYEDRRVELEARLREMEGRRDIKLEVEQSWKGQLYRGYDSENEYMVVDSLYIRTEIEPEVRRDLTKISTETLAFVFDKKRVIIDYFKQHGPKENLHECFKSMVEVDSQYSLIVDCEYDIDKGASLCQNYLFGEFRYIDGLDEDFFVTKF